MMQPIDQKFTDSDQGDASSSTGPSGRLPSSDALVITDFEETLKLATHYMHQLIGRIERVRYYHIERIFELRVAHQVRCVVHPPTDFSTWEQFVWLALEDYVCGCPKQWAVVQTNREQGYTCYEQGGCHGLSLLSGVDRFYVNEVGMVRLEQQGVIVGVLFPPAVAADFDKPEYTDWRVIHIRLHGGVHGWLREPDHDHSLYGTAYRCHNASACEDIDAEIEAALLARCGSTVLMDR